MTRKRKWLATGVVVLVLGGTAGGIAAYQWYYRIQPLSGTVHASMARSQRLMALAASEASHIKDVDVRLTRLLNLADLQIQRDWKIDARATLISAAGTLRSDEASELNDHARLSGWISISELSRSADDKATATDACDGATKAMLALEDPGRRCQYVMGIANELQYLKGKPAAAALLDQAAPWTPSIDDIAQRRQAVVSFASALFNLDDYLAGQRMLQKESDAAWRSEILTQLASLAGQGESPAIAERKLPMISGEQLSPTAGAPAQLQPQIQGQPYFGRQLGYKQVFQNNLRSNTTADRPSTTQSGKH